VVRDGEVVLTREVDFLSTENLPKNSSVAGFTRVNANDARRQIFDFQVLEDFDDDGFAIPVHKAIRANF
jgi:hypothetical protein